jgi:hypothetical protein
MYDTNRQMHTVILIHPCLAFVQRHCKEQYLRKSAYVIRRDKYRTVVNVTFTFTLVRLAMNPKARSFSTIIGYYLLVGFGRPADPSYAAGTKKPRSPTGRYTESTILLFTMLHMLGRC